MNLFFIYFLFSLNQQKGDNIKAIREQVNKLELKKVFKATFIYLQSGARITISDGSTPERIVTINGVVENVNKAFSMICKKFEDVCI